MINSREADSSSNISKASTAAATTTAAISSWSRLKDPRIVRVSRALGGKDRHSKVCTVRGLRDRRVRLSVPTAIQLYDLQERLGLNQPSKVVDWLLNAAKNEIDGLPPLQIPQGSIGFTQNDQSQSCARNEEEKHDHDHDQYNHNTFLSRQNVANATFERWEPSNLTLSQPPISLGLNPHHHHHHHHHHQQQQQQHEDLHAVYQITQPYFTSNYDHRLHSAAPIRPVFMNFNMTADDEQSKRGGDLHSS